MHLPTLVILTGNPIKVCFASTIWSILVKISCSLQKNVYYPVVVLYISIRKSWLITLLMSSMYIMVLYPLFLSIADRGMLMPPTITVYLSISSFCLSVFPSCILRLHAYHRFYVFSMNVSLYHHYLMYSFATSNNLHYDVCIVRY